jgi:hypothetical protein
MRYTLLIIAVCLLFTACKKDKFTTAPQISFNSYEPNTWYSNSTISPGPMLNIQLTDAEGDFGFNDNKDTSYVYIKNLTIPPFDIDSLKFPVLSNTVAKKNFNAEISVDLREGRGILRGSGIRNRVDTLYFEVYVKDFAKNKSNVIKTTKPFYLITP